MRPPLSRLINKNTLHLSTRIDWLWMWAASATWHVMGKIHYCDFTLIKYLSSSSFIICEVIVYVVSVFHVVVG